TFAPAFLTSMRAIDCSNETSSEPRTAGATMFSEYSNRPWPMKMKSLTKVTLRPPARTTIVPRYAALDVPTFGNGSSRTVTDTTWPLPDCLSSYARQSLSFGRITREKSVATAFSLLSTWLSWSNTTEPLGYVKRASACPVTVRSDSFGSKPGHCGAVSLLGVLLP